MNLNDIIMGRERLPQLISGESVNKPQNMDYDSFINKNPQPVVVKKLKLTITYTNGKSYKVTGVTTWSYSKNKSGGFDVNYTAPSRGSEADVITTYSTNKGNVSKLVVTHPVKGGLRKTETYDFGVAK